jgi:hypothetical protein
LFIQDKELVRQFELEGVKFGFIPKLDAITFGEYVDLDKYIGDWDEMHRAMSVLFRPIANKIKEEYTITEYEGTNQFCEIMKFMPLNVVLGAQVFFYNLGSELLKALPNYLHKQAKETILQGHSINSLEETLDTLRKSLDYQLLQPLHT